MIKPLMFTYLAMVIVVIVMDYKHLRQGAAINRWISYGVIACSIGIWIYVTHLSKTFFITVWLTHWIQRLLPMP